MLRSTVITVLWLGYIVSACGFSYTCITFPEWFVRMWHPTCSGVLLKWRWVYAKGRGEGPEGTLLIYDHKFVVLHFCPGAFCQPSDMRCCLRCRRLTGKQSHFRFPSDYRRQLWINYCRRLVPQFVLQPHQRLCSVSMEVDTGFAFCFCWRSLTEYCCKL